MHNDDEKKTIKPLAELLDSVRDIEGFPIGRDEDILNLSDPPHYTACPNPYIDEFIAEHGTPYDETTDDYHREPFIGDVSEGKNDPIYNAHSYHTKVPHKAIMKYIAHYTKEGDIVFDGFCGTGMTGVAAQLLNRKAILSDLSPIATFIAYNYNKKVDVKAFEREALRILDEVEAECGWMYKTNHTKKINPEIQLHLEGKEETGKGTINYTVWSDVFICPFCGQEIVFWEAAVDKENGAVLKDFSCPHCQATTQKTACKRATRTFFDSTIKETITQAKQVPVLINYTWNRKRYEKTPDSDDLALIDKIEESEIPYWFPTDRMPEGDESRRNDRTGITHVHHFYTKRNLWVLASIFEKCSSKPLRLWFNSQLVNISKLNRHRPNVSFPYNPLSGTLYVSSQCSEANIFIAYFNKIKRFTIALKTVDCKDCVITTQSATSTSMKENCIDYIFTDPPFGDNLMYSELSYLWEAWLKVKTNNRSEAIINKSQNKGLQEYADLMLRSFKEFYRVLKPNRWITVEFHNSKSSVWNAIQDAMAKAGFIIANVAVLDKQQGSFKQVTSAGAVKNDLVISAYKPRQNFEERFREQAGQGFEEEFVQMHLFHLPSEPSVERTEQMLYSKLLAYYVQRGYTVTYDARQFYALLHRRFVQQDGFWFNPEQIDAYHEYKKKMKLQGIKDIQTGQTNLFVSDEKSALIWLHSFLNEPKDYSTVYIAFTKISNISDDQVPELGELLEDNFIKENSLFRRPQSEDENMSVKEKRERELLREFDNLLLEAKASKRRIKSCRKQAVVFGFEHCYKSGRFQDILTLGQRLDPAIIENDLEISEFIDIARIKIEGA
ncbi:MAG TPA: DNA methyltransferase [bacterium]|nr:DNA methyltransferase [bacterium]HPM99355.1 DNA methyltransferase [bacterium]